MSGLGQLPSDVKLLVVSHLTDGRDVGALCCVSKEWRRLLDTNGRIWHSLFVSMLAAEDGAWFARLCGEFDNNARLAFGHVVRCFNDRVFRSASSGVAVALLGDGARRLEQFLKEGAQNEGVPVLRDAGGSVTLEHEGLTVSFVCNPECTARSLLRFDVALMVAESGFEKGPLGEVFGASLKMPVCGLILAASVAHSIDKRVDLWWSTTSMTTVFRLLLVDVPKYAQEYYCKSLLSVYQGPSLKRKYRRGVQRLVDRIHCTLLKEKSTREVFLAQLKSNGIVAAEKLLRDKLEAQEEEQKSNPLGVTESFAESAVGDSSFMRECFGDVMEHLCVRKLLLFEGLVDVWDPEDEDVLAPSRRALTTAHGLCYHLTQEHSPERWCLALKSAIAWLECAMPLQRPVLAQHIGLVDAVRCCAWRFNETSLFAQRSATLAMNWARSGDLGQGEEWAELVHEAICSKQKNVRDAAFALQDAVVSWNPTYEEEEAKEEKEQEQHKEEEVLEEIVVVHPKVVAEVPERRITPQVNKKPASRSWWLWVLAVGAFLIWRYRKRLWLWLRNFSFK